MNPIEAAASRAANTLMAGRVVLFRGSPGGAAATVLECARQQLNEAAITFPPNIDVRTIGPAIRARCQQVGFAVVFAMNFGEALATPGGWPLHNALVANCINDVDLTVGLGVHCRPREPLYRDGMRGSPIASAATSVIHAPIWEHDDLTMLLTRRGLSVATSAPLVAQFGPLLAVVAGIEQLPEEAVRGHVFAAIAHLPPHGWHRLAELLRRDRPLPRQDDDRYLGDLVFQQNDTTLAPRLLHTLGVRELLPGVGAKWPRDAALAQRRFAARLADASGPVTWVDRYLSDAPPRRLAEFVRGAARYVPQTELRLLTAGRAGPDLRTELERINRDAQLRRVALREMAAADVAPLHERQLVFEGRPDGFCLPPCDRIIGTIPPGNEVDTFNATFEHSLIGAAWARARIVV